MATHHNTRLSLKKKTLFRFAGREGDKRGVSTDPTTLTLTLTSNVTIFLSKK
ncbi:hypothetical protein POKO110462_13255 [Pontibacter korlensis]|uniref:hypothetical protein n=1 Tax=Pontibacter korlensis TaxID=400092 RepID=UPI000AEA7110|nr:hypothetical protein [Pontibacter korlensis]